jgi:hypothetical protein
MNPISGEASQVPDPPLHAEEGALRSSKRAVMTNIRLEHIANTLMEPNNMRQFGIVVKTTAQGQAAKKFRTNIQKFSKFHQPKKSSTFKWMSDWERRSEVMD